MNKMNEDEAIDIILGNKKEYEEIIKELEDVGDANVNKPIGTIKACQKFVQAIETILDLYKQEKEKNSKLQKRNDKQFRLLRKKDKEIQEIKDISEHDWEERCRLTFKLENYISKDKINDMKRYREFELQQQYKDFENDSEWKTYNKILEEG